MEEKAFPGRGYVPQALTHGTLECDNKEASAAFYRDVLGLQIAGGGRISTYIKHASTPWYIVVLPMKKRKHLAPVNRFTLKMDGPAAVEAAHRELSSVKGMTELFELQRKNGGASFLLSDLDRNWWEVTA